MPLDIYRPPALERRRSDRDVREPERDWVRDRDRGRDRDRDMDRDRDGDRDMGRDRYTDLFGDRPGGARERSGDRSRDHTGAGTDKRSDSRRDSSPRKGTNASPTSSRRASLASPPAASSPTAAPLAQRKLGSDGGSTATPTPPHPGGHPPQSRPESGSLLDLTEHLCRRNYWFTELATSRKSLAHYRAQLDRGKAAIPEFPEALGVVEALLKKATSAEHKNESRLREADQSIAKAVGMFIGRKTQTIQDSLSAKYERDLEARFTTIQAKAEAKICAKLVTELEKFKAEAHREQEARFTSFQAKTEANFAAKLMTEVNNVKLETKREQEAQAMVLTARIDELNKRNQQLEAQREVVATSAVTQGSFTDAIKDLNGRVASIAAALDDGQSAIKVLQETSAARDKAEQAVEARLRALGEFLERPELSAGASKIATMEAAIAVLQDDFSTHTAAKAEVLTHLVSLETSIGALEVKVAEPLRNELDYMRMKVDRCTPVIERLLDTQAKTDATLVSLESIVDALPAAVDLVQLVAAHHAQGGSPNPKPMSDEVIRGLVASEIRHMEAEFRTKFKTLADSFGTIINGERGKREVQDKGQQQLQDRLSSIIQTVAETKEARNTAAAEFDNRFQQQAAQVTSVQQNLDAMVARLDTLDQTDKQISEETNMQLSNIVAWQDNFTTKTLSRDIADVIRATMPGSVDVRLTDVEARIHVIENRLRGVEPGPLKKRRLDNGGAILVNGNH